MGRTDWELILSVDPSSVTDDEIEELCPMIVQCDLEELDDLPNLRHIGRLSQEMLQYKDNQVESLLVECAELKEVIESLKPAAAKRKKKESEVIDTAEETSSFPRRAGISEGIATEETLQTKNKKIQALISELETLDKENLTLKERLTILTEEMKDATLKMNEMTEELSSLHHKTSQYKDKLRYLEEQNIALVTQIEEANGQQMSRDKVIDDFSLAIEARINEWKEILDEKDGEINRLKESLSQTLVHSLTSAREQSKSQLVHLAEEIERRDKIIEEFQEKLSQAVIEINESASLIEKLRADAQKIGKTDKRKEQKDQLKKLEDSNQRILDLQKQLTSAEDELETRSSQLCDALSTLNKYENKEQALTDALNQAKELSNELARKAEHITDLVSVVNKLEMLNSYQELEIISLREKLGIPEDESILIENRMAKRCEESKKQEELARKSQELAEENLELKSSVRILKYNLSKSRAEEVDDSVDHSRDFFHSTKLTEARIEPDIQDLRIRMEIVVKENEALRTGMHEILDSIRNQDGKSEVEIQSSTLERLLEALDVRHLAGWYHPAMRLQEHLNVIQGSNAELRNQIRHLRRELERKDAILQHLALRKSTEPTNSDDSANEDLALYISELKNLREAYENEADEWEKQKESLLARNHQCNDQLEQFKLQVELYQENLKQFEGSEQEVEQALARKVKELIEASSEILLLTKKNSILQDLLNKESSIAYQSQKDAIRNESSLKQVLADLTRRNRSLETRVSTLHSNLSNSVSLVVYNELKSKYEETCLKLRSFLQSPERTEEFRLFKEDLKEFLLKIEASNSTNLEQDLNKVLDEIRKLYEIRESEFAKSEERMKEMIEAKSALEEELIALHRQLSKETSSSIHPELPDENQLRELQDSNESLKIENESLKQLLKASQEEAQLQYSTNSLKTLELDSLRHQILDLQAVSEDKATISRLDFELTRKNLSEIELNQRKLLLESEVGDLRAEVERLRDTVDGYRNKLEDSTKRFENRFRNQTEIISFLQSQYAGSTPLCTLEKVSRLSENLRKARQELEAEKRNTRESGENVKLQQDVLNNRLQIVESLKEILEQQIGASNVHEIVQRFSEYSQYTFADFKYKRRIIQLESELSQSTKKFVEYESMISSLEQDLFDLQKVWAKPRDSRLETQTSSTSPLHLKKNPISTQTSLQTKSSSIQTESSDTCSNKPELISTGIQVKLQVEPPTEQVESKTLQEQLSQALKLASERSNALIKCQVQLSESQAKLDLLKESMLAKDAQVSRLENELEEKSRAQPITIESTDVQALKSTINSTQKLLDQKEEIISRYQTLLREDREESSKTIARLTEEIKELQEESEARSKSQVELAEKVLDRNLERLEGVAREDEIARLCEKVSHLEADLDISKQLSERWHRLAEERLDHVDLIREKLEEQHKSELESYRSEITKWQTEVEVLRKQLSENRTLLSRGNISMMKELQERDNKIHELNLSCQQLQNEVEMLASTNRTHPIVIQSEREFKSQESAHTTTREHMLQTDATLRKQLQTLIEKEKMYKQELAELKQQLSRRYMAAKTQDKRVSQRETQLQNKIRSLEEDLQRMRGQLNHEFLIHEAKKAKTAEELSLWDKQKKWQQTADKLKEKLKEKNEEHAKLLASYEKLRAVVACMEREKWYLRSKLKIENTSIAGSFSARPPIETSHQNCSPSELQSECEALRNRVAELNDRLCTDNNAKLLLKVEEQRRRIAALETVSEGKTCIASRLEKLELTKELLERTNLKLESENFELRLRLENINVDAPRLREKIQHLEKYIDLLKVEKSTDSSPRSLDKDVYEHRSSSNKSVSEMEKTIFTLKRIVERLQVENKRLRATANKCSDLNHKQEKSGYDEADPRLSKLDEAQRRIVTLEADLQLAEQRVAMFESIERDNDTAEIGLLKDQLHVKSELLEKMKSLLAKAALNEKSLRQRVELLEGKKLSSIPECHVRPATPE